MPVGWVKYREIPIPDRLKKTVEDAVVLAEKLEKLETKSLPIFVKTIEAFHYWTELKASFDRSFAREFAVPIRMGTAPSVTDLKQKGIKGLSESLPYPQNCSWRLSDSCRSRMGPI
jgi:hypothetical protein